MTIAELKQLAHHAAHRTAPTEFSVSNVDAAVADEFKRLTGSINDFMRNRYDIYDIIIENADDIVPAKVMDAMGQFAEVITIGNGDQKVFKRGGLGRNRAKKFLTQVGLNGLYETFRLDHETFTIGMKAIGGAVGIDFERLMDGAESLAEFMSVLTEAQEDAIYVEVQSALMNAANSTVMPAANKVTGSYSAAELQKLVNTVKIYGGSATIFASPEFVAEMGPDAIVPPTANLPGVYSPKDIEDIATNGRIKMFRGTPIVELRQSFLDERNAELMINPQFAYVLPSGKEKIVKVLIEGATQMYDVVNPDQSIEVHTYKKIGVGILAFNNWGVYKNTNIKVNDGEGSYNWYNPARLGIDIAKV
jgi:hypothetical protein